MPSRTSSAEGGYQNKMTDTLSHWYATSITRTLSAPRGLPYRAYTASGPVLCSLYQFCIFYVLCIPFVHFGEGGISIPLRCLINNSEKRHHQHAHGTGESRTYSLYSALYGRDVCFLLVYIFLLSTTKLSAVHSKRVWRPLCYRISRQATATSLVLVRSIDLPHSPTYLHEESFSQLELVEISLH